MLSSVDTDLTINKNEVYRYLGYRGTSPDPETQSRIDKCIDEVLEASELRGMYQEYPLIFDDESEFSIDAIKIKSKDLAKNLRSCTQVYVMGATIGIGVDRLIARAGISNVLSAAVYQAVGAAYIEEYCDAINGEIRNICEEKGLGLRPRFSPGYGDFVLEYQRDLFGLLNLPKHVGISLSESLIMTPSKSVTAVIGAYPLDENSNCPENNKHNCDICNLSDCAFRRI